MITAKHAMAQITSKVRSWQFLRQLAKAEKRDANTHIYASHAEQCWSIGLMGAFGHLNNNKHTHKDWTK